MAVGNYILTEPFAVQVNIANPVDGEISPRRVFDLRRIICKRKLLGGVTFCATAGLTMGVALTAPRSFNASTSLMVGPGVNERSFEGAPRIARMLESFAKIASSDEVVRSAVEKVGLGRLLEAQAANFAAAPGQGGRLDRFSAPPWLADRGNDAGGVAPLDQALPAIVKALTIKAELSSDVIDVSFRHKNPAVAAEFANAVAEAFIDRLLRLFSLDKKAAFFDRQAGLFNEEVKRASDAFERFRVANKAFSIAQQKELLLKRASGLSSALLATRAAIADKNGQAEALAAQLHKLKPVAGSNFASSVVDELKAKSTAAGPVGRSGDTRSNIGDTPPMLMIRVFEDSMVTLFKTNAELKGLRELETQQAQQLDGINAELAGLVAKETEFSQLERAVAQAQLNAETYARRAVEQRVDANMSEAKFSEVKIIQRAYPPLKSSFPGAFAVGLLSLANGLLVALATILLAEFWAAGRASRQNLADVGRGQAPQGAFGEMRPAE